MRADFEALAEFGRTESGGVHRPTFSEAHLAAREWFLGSAADAGFDTAVDQAGNHSARFACGTRAATGERASQPSAVPTLLIGSHLDSVPNGGRFDGALGVVAALEVLRTIQDSGLWLPVDLEAIDFTDEEGTLVGMLGSSALAGTLDPAELRTPRGGRDRLLAGLERAGMSEEGLFEARRNPVELAGYLELHIEQGPRLAQANTNIGIVNSIVGITSEELVFHGKSNHAGTTPMDARCDAGLGAADFIVRAHQLIRQNFRDSVVNCGRLEFEPGAYNIIPELARLALEFRSPREAESQQVEAALHAELERTAARFGLRVEVLQKAKWHPVQMHEAVQAALETAANGLGLSHQRLHSGAGHDAERLARTTPAGMVFIPSPNGISHDPREFSPWEDCVNGANVLVNAALELARTAAMRNS